jgi:hypothetical protein
LFFQVNKRKKINKEVTGIIVPGKEQPGEFYFPFFENLDKGDMQEHKKQYQIYTFDSSQRVTIHEIYLHENVVDIYY